MTVESVDKPPRIVIKSGDIAVHIRVAEHFEAEVVKPRDNLSRAKHWKGTGELRLFLSHESWSSGKCIADSFDERLESKGETILSAIDRQLAAARIADLERKDRDRRWQEERERAETERKRQERERLRLKEEQDRRDALEKEATNWDRAEKLRLYAAMLEEKLSTRSRMAAANGAHFVDELLDAANFLDPCEERLESFDAVIQPESP